MMNEDSSCVPSFTFRFHLVRLFTTSPRVRLLRLIRHDFYDTLATTGPLYDTFDIDYGTRP
jgi:hypothetical protein